MQKNITPEYVRGLKVPTQEFLCKLSANRFNIQFLNFTIRDIETNKTFFEIGREQATEEELREIEQYQPSPEEEIELRTVRYHFGDKFFDIKTIGTSLTFSIGNKPVKNFLMIERHYFRNKLIKSYEFQFPFCPPTTTNNWEAIYDVPVLDQNLRTEMINNPWETQSDSFYFVANELVMHNKAQYSYEPKNEDEDDDSGDDF